MANYQDLLNTWAVHKARYPMTDITLDKEAIDEIVQLNGECAYDTLLEWLKHDLNEEAARLDYKSHVKC